MARDASGAVDALVQAYVELYPEEVARELEELPVQETVAFLQTRAPSRAGAVIECLTPDLGSRALESMSLERAADVLAEMDPGRAASLLARLDEDAREKRLGSLPPRRAAELRQVMTYPEDSAGRWMDPRVMSFRPEMTVSGTLARLRRSRGRRVYEIFLIDERGRLTGSVPVPDLAFAAPRETLASLRRPPSHFVQATATREEIVETFSRQGPTVLPVVDFEGRLLGVIRQDALLAAAQEEASADIQTMVGASKQERALSPVLFAVRKRLPWLEINLGTAFLAASVVGLFEDMIARFTALAVLLPVVAGQSGNTGAQALAVTMRGLALREIRARHWFRVCWKETNVALLNGLLVAVTTAFFVYLWSRSIGLSLVIGLSMVISMIIAGLSGAAIPIVLTSLGQDPAQSSSIILTTVTDVMGFFSFLGIATALSQML